jgi:hypothetical protein
MLGSLGSTYSVMSIENRPLGFSACDHVKGPRGVEEVATLYAHVMTGSHDRTIAGGHPLTATV